VESACVRARLVSFEESPTLTVLDFLLFRTPPLHADEKTDDPCSVLARHLPNQAHELIFGGQDTSPTKRAAASVAAVRRIPALSIYVISTNSEHDSALEFLFQDVPHRMFQLQNTDFFTKEQGAYETLGVDRVAALFAGTTSYQAPVMVLDGGTAWTYTAVDKHCHLLGGGISPGIMARFRSMSDYCGKLPMIEYETYQKVVQTAIDNKAPLPTFATNTETAMMSAVFSEVACQCRNLVKQFLASVKEKETSKPGDDAAGRKKPTIVVTGGDSLFLAQLLKEEQPIIVEGEPGTALPVAEITVETVKHLVHYGIGHVLKVKVGQAEPAKEEDEIRERIVGQRVAKHFQVSDYDGDYVYRGSVTGVKPGAKLEDDLYFVRYDDNDGEHLGFDEVHGKLFCGMQ
jgi:pantothenate kinase type III